MREDGTSGSCLLRPGQRLRSAYCVGLATTGHHQDLLHLVIPGLALPGGVPARLTGPRAGPSSQPETVYTLI